MAAEYTVEFPDVSVYCDYADLFESDDVDAVYVATTHNFHYENVKLCLEAGKHVLCEKPITINAAQLEELRTLAWSQGCFLMEALWTRFLPGIIKLRELIEDNTIGDIRFLQANFGIEANQDPQHRLMNRDLAGGALLDLGIYPLNFACIVFDSMPVEARSLAAIGQTGVDELSAYLLQFAEGRIAVLSSSCAVNVPHTAVLYGSEGSITVEDFFHPSRIIVETEKGRSEYDVSFPSSGFQYEIEESCKCILAGMKESELHSLSRSMSIMQLMDGFRKDWGLQYPGE
ncbi:Gfo/Idh/MocA family oxidoreductase [Spirochaeta dissipatitropha]